MKPIDTHVGGGTQDRVVLHLILSFDWWNQVLSGNKTVEYRRICPNWTRLIWSRRESIKRVVFHKGYTDTVIECDVLDIDIGPCPYAGWEGNYYRIHFRMKNPSHQGTTHLVRRTLDGVVQIQESQK